MRATLFLLCVMALGFTSPLCSRAQGSKKSEPDLGYLTLNHTHRRWPEPETVLKSLRGNDEARSNALDLMGYPPNPSSNFVETPSDVQLRYAPLGSDESQQAIVGVRLGQMLYGAVAAQQNGVWYRIANYSCWCKYERGDFVGNFIQLQTAPDDRYELVLSASGGGTGVYLQNEERFRYHHGELHLVFSFISQFRECDPTTLPYRCRYERRWFGQHGWDAGLDALLVEAHFSFLADRVPEVEFDLRDLALRHVNAFTCKAYKWKEERFAYESVPFSSVCKPRSTSE